MFGPNVHLETKTSIRFSHRDRAFFEMYNNLQEIFKEKFNLESFDILYLPGSGTLGIESLFFSIEKNIEVIGPRGIFWKRWNELSKIYNSSSYKGTTQMFCQLETSLSETYEKQNCIVDAISSFPFYPIPSQTLAFVTCSNKQLGSMPGLAIVGVRKDSWEHFLPKDRFSYLNLNRYRQYSIDNQTPSTPPIMIFEHLLETLKSFDIESNSKKIVRNSKLISNSVGHDNIIGNKIGPVITVSKNAIPKEIANDFELYGLNNPKSKYYQIFTYSCDDNLYELFSDKLNGCKDR